jgi:LysR family nitrogen assimilation transcriptional regulator
MNFKRLRYFAKVVDVGSLTKAADLLHIAQPALSQQIVTLEAEVHQKLLVRTQRGVTPTEAGKSLYRHAQIILRQCDQARMDMAAEALGVAGPVSVGLAPGTAASTLALPLIREVRTRHPGIILYLNENYGTTLSELIMNGRMDLAVLYGNRTVHGLAFRPLLDEELFLVTASGPGGDVKLAELHDMELFLPRPYNIVRKLVDEHFMRLGLTPRVVAEIESAVTLKAIVAEGLGATILPASMAREVAGTTAGACRLIVEPVIRAPLTLCESDNLPLSEPAQAVKGILLELVASHVAEAGWLPGSGDPGAP